MRPRGVKPAMPPTAPTISINRNRIFFVSRSPTYLIMSTQLIIITSTKGTANSTTL